MKHTLLKLAVSIMCCALRRYGWSDDPPPPPYKGSSRYPWWRKLAHNRIEAQDFSGAVKCCISEMMADSPVASKLKTAKQ